MLQVSVFLFVSENDFPLNRMLGTLPCDRLTREVIEGQGVSLEEAMMILRQYLPRNSILVGQNIGKDVDWLQLKEGQDYQVPSAFTARITRSFTICIGTYACLHACRSRTKIRAGHCSYINALLCWKTVLMVGRTGLLAVASGPYRPVQNLEQQVQDLERLWAGSLGKGAAGLEHPELQPRCCGRCHQINPPVQPLQHHAERPPSMAESPGQWLILP